MKNYGSNKLLIFVLFLSLLLNLYLLNLHLQPDYKIPSQTPATTNNQGSGNTTPKVISAADVQAAADRRKMTLTEATEKFKAAGYDIQ